MKQTALIYGFFGILIGLTIGFWIANAFNRNFPAPPSRQNSVSLQSDQQSQMASEKLSREEVKNTFAAAENRKDDLDFQKKLGLSLARYAAVQNDTSFLSELIVLLERANRLSNEKDAEILTALAEVSFTKAGENSDSTLYQKARILYQQAVRLKPDNADFKTAYAATFLFSKPNQPEVAITELSSILKQSPQHEEALRLLTLALIQSDKLELAERKISELKKINSDNPTIPDLEAQLKQNKIKIKR